MPFERKNLVLLGTTSKEWVRSIVDLDLDWPKPYTEDQASEIAEALGKNSSMEHLRQVIRAARFYSAVVNSPSYTHDLQDDTDELIGFADAADSFLAAFGQLLTGRVSLGNDTVKSIGSISGVITGAAERARQLAEGIPKDRSGPGRKDAQEILAFALCLIFKEAHPDRKYPPGRLEFMRLCFEPLKIYLGDDSIKSLAHRVTRKDWGKNLTSIEIGLSTSYYNRHL